MPKPARPRVELAKTDHHVQLDVRCHHFPSGHVLYLYHALGKGYFADEKILPVFARADHSPKVVESLAAGIDFVGLATASQVILSTGAYVEGGGRAADFPVKIVYQSDQNYASAFYSLSNAYRAKLGLPLYANEITAPEDLIGKIVRPGGGTPTILFEVLVRRKGLADRVHRSFDGDGFRPDMINVTGVPEFDVKTFSHLMLTGQIDVYSKPVFGHGQFLGRALSSQPDLEYRSFSTVQAGLPSVYGVGIVAHSRFVSEHADILKAFLRAVDRGMRECVGDPAYGVGVMNRLRGFGPEYDAIEGIKADIAVGRHPEITGRGGFFGGADAERYGYGCVRRERLAELIELLRDSGMLRARVAPDDVCLDVEFR